jgi:hypothetical protein
MLIPASRGSACGASATGSYGPLAGCTLKLEACCRASNCKYAAVAGSSGAPPREDNGSGIGLDPSLKSGDESISDFQKLSFEISEISESLSPMAPRAKSAGEV